jgi:RimJ/RimL family protein N-acetyltransferase
MTSFAIPTIETDRLTLRGPRESDFEAFAAFGASERAKWVGGPYSRARSWGGFLGMFGHWALRGYGFWMLETKSGSDIAGRVGFTCHDGWDEPELGWHIFDGFEGKGYAFEAVNAARAYAAQRLGLNGVISYIAKDNTRSRSLAERLGATFERDGELLGQPCQIFRHPKQEVA